MKKIIFILILIVLFVPIKTLYATENNLAEFVTQIKQYSNEYFPELSNENFLEDVISGNISTDNLNLFKKIINAGIGEFKNSLSLIASIICISILCSIFKNIQGAFGESGISEIAFYVCYILIIILIVSSFTDISTLCKDTIEKLNNFMKLVVPLVISLIISTGNAVTVSMMQPVILTMITVITNLMSNFILPIIFISTIINIVTNISEHIEMEKIAGFLRKSALWVTEFILVIFVGILSIEGSLSSTIDGITSKTAKTIVASAVPVVGKILSDTVDSVIGGLVISKNAIGIIGIIVILAITIVPLLKTFILMTTFNIASAVIEPISDKRITKCMSGMADSVKIIFAILATVVFLFVISITFMLKITNFALMYRWCKMTNWISTYMLTLVSVIILITLIEIILPTSNNKKYIKFVSGLILIVTIINPISKALNTNIDLDKFLSQNEFEIENISNSMATNYYDNYNLYESYKSNLETDIISRLEDNGYEVLSIDVEVNNETYTPEKVWINIKHSDGEVQPVVIDVFGNKGFNISSYEEASIKNIINYNYDISNKNIYINE